MIYICSLKLGTYIGPQLSIHFCFILSKIYSQWYYCLSTKIKQTSEIENISKPDAFELKCSEYKQNANEAKMITCQLQQKMTTQQWKGLVDASNLRWQWPLLDERQKMSISMQ